MVLHSDNSRIFIMPHMRIKGLVVALANCPLTANNPVAEGKNKLSFCPDKSLELYQPKTFSFKQK